MEAPHAIPRLTTDNKKLIKKLTLLNDENLGKTEREKINAPQRAE